MTMVLLLPANGRAKNFSRFTFLLLLSLHRTTAWVLPFFSSNAPSSLEEQDRWLSTPSKVVYQDFHSKTSVDESHDDTRLDRVLILTPLKDAAAHLPHHFDLLTNLTYSHRLIDLGFIIGDTTDDTQSVLKAQLDRIGGGQAKNVFHSCTTVFKDLGDVASQEVVSRHGFAAQVDRRKKIAIVRNTLLQKTLKPDHKWVYWRDVDIAESPNGILEDFIAHDKDVLVPSTSYCKLATLIAAYMS